MSVVHQVFAWYNHGCVCKGKMLADLLRAMNVKKTSDSRFLSVRRNWKFVKANIYDPLVLMTSEELKKRTKVCASTDHNILQTFGRKLKIRFTL
jgi:hypothetical protein